MTDDLLIERLLRVIDEGRRTATYKLALVLGIIDAAAMCPGSAVLANRLIAERVVALYYPQTRAYVAADGIQRELRQITMKDSPVLRSVLRLRLHGDNAGCRSADEARRAIPTEYERAVSGVEDTFVRYPIPLMQVVGSRAVPFLYSIDWPEGTSAKTLRSEGKAFIQLLDGVADRLAVLGPLLRPLIELHWTSDVARWSGVALEDDALRAHLFGSQRVAFPRGLVSGLRELQNDVCFYCGDRLAPKTEVDHFLAWSRWPNDAIENLVIADACNGAKSDHLAAGLHLVKWRRHVEELTGDLAAVADRQRWLSDPARTCALVQTTYSHIAAGTPLWRLGKEFELASGPL